jgi:hypothetical protein
MSILCLLVLEAVSQVAKSVRLPGKMSAFLNQDPKQVAALCVGVFRL